MSTTPKVIAIACGDLHLQHKPPRCRECEPDWYAAMARPLGEIRELARKYSTSTHNVLVICAGDIFDRWNSPPELINWAILHVQSILAIPGQHDLPEHNYEDRHRSAYETLVRAGHAVNLPPSFCVTYPGLLLTGFPWGFDVEGSSVPSGRGVVSIAVAHEYNWIAGTEYPGAEKTQRITTKRKNLLDFDVVIFGDNHKGFHTRIGNTEIFNCGTMMRRKIDEIDYKPQVGLIYSDGTVVPHFLDISQDKIEVPEISEIDPEVALNAKDFLDELSSLEQNPLDFRLAVERYVKTGNVSKKVEAALLEAMG